MKIFATLLFTVIVLFSTACSYVPYRIDVDQGNLIDQKALSKLSIGMSKSEVQQVLGSALLTDIFHRDRWDYVQYYQQGDTQSVQESQVTLHFVNGLLRRIDHARLKKIQIAPLPYSVAPQ